MPEMSVEEALRWIENIVKNWSPDISWHLREWERDAMRVVLDELKALQECKSCGCTPGERAGK